MKTALIIFFSTHIFYSAKIEQSRGGNWFGPSPVVMDTTAGITYLKAKPKYIMRTDSTVIVSYPGKRICYILQK